MSKENKIDPEPEYRRLMSGERVLEGDEEFYPTEGKWVPITNKSHTAFWDGGEVRRKLYVPSAESAAKALQALASAYSHVPKSFTPNKYTRWVPTLDGLTAPVDVYGVSEAFDIRSNFASAGAVEAILHGRKKLLAPGQRGAKSALQDIKEARDSLIRAIALEEAALERGDK